MSLFPKDRNLAVAPDQDRRIRRRAHQDLETFYTSIIDLKIDGKAEQAIVRDVQHHPFKVDMMHIDFQRVDAKHALHMHVPLHYIGE